ncbi:MAG: radical SAM family heme chaperone HemW [Candidatus Margulisiibacteriota bacterium]|jgi:oxygen-independent coproporphyrinogen-3 oxidase
MKGKVSSLYIHIPFCLQKCAYCDFYSVAGSDQKMIKEYIDELSKEIGKQRASTLRTVFFGGGTPSLLSKQQLGKLMKAIRGKYSLTEEAEISLEANPETIAKDLTKLKQYREIGINRVSLGCQSFDNKVLSSLGRIHNADTNIKAYRNLRRAGFKNINIDLIFAVPGQTRQSWERTLRKAISLKPEHISLYNLTTEHGLASVLKDQELDLGMYRLARKLLKQAGYVHYEVSNFAKPGFEGRHNTTYWRNEPYLGLGASAASSTTADDPSMTVILGLRLLQEGVQKSRFLLRHGVELDVMFGKEIEKLRKLKMIKVDERRLKLTARGLEVANMVFGEFV